MEEALDWVKRCPNPHNDDGEIEIRPIFEPEDFGLNDPAGTLRAAEVRLREQTARK